MKSFAYYLFIFTVIVQACSFIGSRSSDDNRRPQLAFVVRATEEGGEAAAKEEGKTCGSEGEQQCAASSSSAETAPSTTETDTVDTTTTTTTTTTTDASSEKEETPVQDDEEEDPNCPSRALIIRCAGKHLDTNQNGKLDRDELETAITALPWYARGILQILGSVDKMMTKCDMDGDDAISMDYDMIHNKDQCLASCFKRRAFKKSFFPDCE